MHASASITAAAKPAGTAANGIDGTGELVWVAYRDATDGAVYYHNRFVKDESTYPLEFSIPACPVASGSAFTYH